LAYSRPHAQTTSCFRSKFPNASPTLVRGVAQRAQLDAISIKTQAPPLRFGACLCRRMRPPTEVIATPVVEVRLSLPNPPDETPSRPDALS
jgi:hypothetical protein